MAIPSKEDLRTFIYSRLMTLAASSDDEVAIKAIKELGIVSGVSSENSPKALTAQQTNNFVLSPEQMAGVLSGLRAISNASNPSNPEAGDA